MHKPYIKYILALVVIFFVSCKESKNKKWKIPTDVSFKMDINRSVALGGALSWTNGNIVVGDFTFEGERIQGDDVYFTKTYSSGLKILFDPNTTVSEWDFDIPQGSYTKIKISYKTFGNSGDEHIVLNGTYKNTINNIIYPVRFEFEVEESYEIVAKSSSGSTEIVLNKDVAAFALIKADPVYWFQTVTTNMMDNAALVNIGGNQTIVISKSVNGDIYEAVRDRMDDNVTTVTFN